jgi:hypothetical protein
MQFTSARLKIKRADRHLQELMLTVMTFLKTDFAVILAEEDSETGTYTIKIDLTSPYPPEIPTIIGDAIHNLRTALDHIVTQFTDPKSNWIGLPMAEGRSDVKALRSFRFIRERNPYFPAFILDEIQPYAGGKFKLWEIGQLDNIDKHRLLIPTRNVTSLLNVDIEDEYGNRFRDRHITLDHGRLVGLASGLGCIKIHNKAETAVNILFGDDTPFPGQSIFGTLTYLPQLLLEAIEALELFCFGKITNPNTIEN